MNGGGGSRKARWSRADLSDVEVSPARTESGLRLEVTAAGAAGQRGRPGSSTIEEVMPMNGADEKCPHDLNPDWCDICRRK